MVAKKKPLKADVAKSRPKRSVKASAFLEKLVGKPSFGRLLRSIRKGEDASLAAFAKQLGIARTNLSDIELGRRGVSVERAASWARLLGYHEGQFVKLALQAQLDEAGIKLKVDVHAA
jgi:transcriptional regulator with XRE-family HTH domain